MVATRSEVWKVFFYPYIASSVVKLCGGKHNVVYIVEKVCSKTTQLVALILN